MKNNEDVKDLKNTLISFGVWSLSTIIDSAFLALWIYVQWFVNTKIIKQLNLEGIDQLVLISFQFLFAVSTLAPVVITIYKDILLMIVRTQRKIKREISILKYDEPDQIKRKHQKKKTKNER